MSDLLVQIPVWPVIGHLCAYLAIGIASGTLYFWSVRCSARGFASGGALGLGIALALGRFVLLGALLLTASLRGAGPLLATAMGILIARPVMLRARTVLP